VPDFMALALRDNTAGGEFPIGDINNWIIDGNTVITIFSELCSSRTNPLK
jgi:hypothetical protein